MHLAYIKHPLRSMQIPSNYMAILESKSLFINVAFQNAQQGLAW